MNNKIETEDDLFFEYKRYLSIRGADSVLKGTENKPNDIDSDKYKFFMKKEQ